MDIFVLFPINLYANIGILKNKRVFLVEERLYFDRSNKKLGNYRFNILKPIYHRATMRRYYDYLKSKRIRCTYIELKDDWIKKIKTHITDDTTLCFYDPVDRYLESRLDNNFSSYDIYDTPSFILSNDDMEEYDGPLLQTSFYIWMRKREDILMQSKGGKVKPIGGKMTFDNENRKPPYKNMSKDLPKEANYNNNKYIVDAFRYVKGTIPNGNIYITGNNNLKDVNSLSECGVSIKFPIDHVGSRRRLNTFIKKHLERFGMYQDVIMKEDNSFIYHSGISPMLNIGLLTPRDVIDAIMKYTKYMKNKKIRIQSVEGFIRQILGWREFCRYTYQHHHKLYINKNYFRVNNKLSAKWYEGKTKNVVVDNCIKKAFRYGYLHHIERLMIMANYMVLSNIHPREMYKWFMEFALDSYDWVMEYNVYSMATYSDGGNFTTKPYISSSAYILKMSNYKKSDDNDDWINDWNYRFWSFMNKHKTKIKKIPRLSMLLKHVKKGLSKAKNEYIISIE